MSFCNDSTIHSVPYPVADEGKPSDVKYEYVPMNTMFGCIANLTLTASRVLFLVCNKKSKSVTN